MTRLGDDVVGTFDHGVNNDVDTTAEPLTSVARRATRGVQLKASEANTGTICVGNADVTVGGAEGTEGFPLAAGEGLFLPIDDPSKLYVVADEANQRVHWLVI